MSTRELLDFLDRSPSSFHAVWNMKNELINKDWFMTFPDFKDYCKTKEKAFSDYENRRKWTKKMLVNIANAGYFSSDRTVAEYNKDIWKL